MEEGDQVANQSTCEILRGLLDIEDGSFAMLRYASLEVA